MDLLPQALEPRILTNDQLCLAGQVQRIEDLLAGHGVQGERGWLEIDHVSVRCLETPAHIETFGVEAGALLGT